MRIFSKCKTWMTMAVLAFAVVLSGITAEAKIISKSEEPEKLLKSVGDEMPYYEFEDVVNLKINKKAVAKSKKKVKVVKTGSNERYYYYHTKAYFNDESAYSQGWEEYNSAFNDAIRYIGTSDYTLRFLKPGTYNITYDTYSREDLRFVYDSNGNYKLFNGYDYDNPVSTESFKRVTVGDDIEDDEYGYSYYYQGVTSGTIYAYGEEYCWVQASIKKGADGKNYFYFQPRNMIKTTHTYNVKVLKDATARFSYQLGKAKYVTKTNKKSYSSSSTTTRAPFVSGTKGKLIVKSLDKNYSITSIILMTYDSKGNAVYTDVTKQNKKNISFNPSSYDKTSKTELSYVTYSSRDRSMYKTIRIYVSYKNNFTGAFSKFSVETETYADGTTHQYMKGTYRNPKDEKDKEGWGSCYTSQTFYKK